MSEKNVSFETFLKSASKILKDKGYEVVPRKKTNRLLSSQI